MVRVVALIGAEGGDSCNDEVRAVTRLRGCHAGVSGVIAVAVYARPLHPDGAKRFAADRAIDDVLRQGGILHWPPTDIDVPFITDSSQACGTRWSRLACAGFVFNPNVIQQ